MITILLTVVLEISLYSFRDAAAQVLMEYFNVGSIGANTILGALGMFFAAPAIFFMSKHFGGSKSTHSVVDIPSTDKVQTQSPMDKAYVMWTVDEIFESMKDCTNIQVANIARLHIGRWLRVDDKVANVSELRKEIDIHVYKGFGKHIHLAFDKNLWKTRLETLRIGDSIIAEGKIKTIDEQSIGLEDCEIKEIRPRESSISKESFNNIDPNKCDEK